MGYKIVGSGPHLPEVPALFTGTARDALKKLEDMKHRCHPHGRAFIYFNSATISEEELNQRTQEE